MDVRLICVPVMDLQPVQDVPVSCKVTAGDRHKLPATQKRRLAEENGRMDGWILKPLNQSITRTDQSMVLALAWFALQK